MSNRPTSRSSDDDDEPDRRTSKIRDEPTRRTSKFRDEPTSRMSDFLEFPLEDMNIRRIPGVDHRAAEKLKYANIDTAEKLVGQFLILGRDVDKMADWLMEVCDIRSKEAGKICDALDRKAEKIVSL
jgi:Barrier to autointegration factor